MNTHAVQLRLPEPMLRAASEIAREADITVGQLVRVALEAELKRRRKAAKTPNRAEERLLASLRTLLARDLAVAQGWADLQARLAAKGFAFREAGGGLALHSHPEGTRLCKASELGHSYGSFMRRFGAPFPGHSHRHLEARFLGTKEDGAVSDEVIDPDP